MKHFTTTFLTTSLLIAGYADGALNIGTSIADFDETTPNPNMTPEDAIDGTGLSLRLRKHSN